MRRDVFLALALFLFLSPAAASEPIHKPVMAGEWQELFQPEIAGRYINDHCVYQDPARKWHLVGITQKRSQFGQNEFWFAHGVTGSLDRPMTELDPLFKGWPDDELKWAPHAIWNDGVLHLFAGPGPIRHFTSKDGHEFEYEGNAIDGRWRWLRDTMAIKLGDKWIMYATDYVDKKDVVSAFVSDDLYEWEYAGVVFTARRPAEVWAPAPNSACESPFAIEYQGGYYLSVTLTNYPVNPRPYVYLNTLVFYSDDPLDFGTWAGGKGGDANLVARFEAHAPEYIHDGEGRWWITCSGWIEYPRPKGCPGGKACIAPIEWRKVEEDL